MLMRLRNMNSERWLELRSTISTSSIALADQVVVSGLGFATSIIIGRDSKEMLGLYYLALSIVLFVRGIQESLVAAPYKVFCHRQDVETLPQYAGSSLIHHTLVTILVIAILFVLTKIPLGTLMPDGLQPTMLVLVLTLPLILLRELLRQLSFARMRFTGALAIDSCVAIVQIAGLAWLSSSGNLTVNRAYSVMAVACGGASLGWLLTSTQRLEFDRQAVTRHWKMNWTFGRWAVAAQVIGGIAPYVVPWILSIVKNTEATGLFAACMTLVGASRVLTDAIFNLLTPKSAHAFHHGGREALVGMLVRWGTLFGVMMGCFTLGIFLFGEQTLMFVYGPQYAGTRLPLTILAAALWIHTIGFTCGDGLFVLERTRDNFWADVIATVLTLIVSIPLVSGLGLLGAALATLVALASGAIARFVIFRRCLRELTQAEGA
jgi:O-antigen/teichoic acid export membrane protein